MQEGQTDQTNSWCKPKAGTPGQQATTACREWGQGGWEAAENAGRQAGRQYLGQPCEWLVWLDDQSVAGGAPLIWPVHHHHKPAAAAAAKIGTQQRGCLSQPDGLMPGAGTTKPLPSPHPTPPLPAPPHSKPAHLSVVGSGPM
jgi:hypothetical protein